MTAQRKTINIADQVVEVFQVSEGEYVYSLTSAAKAVGKVESSIRSYASSKELKALLGKELAIRSTPVEGTNKPINAIPSEIVTAYWMKQMTLGNAAAQKLVYSVMKVNLDARAALAFHESPPQTVVEYEVQKVQQEREALKALKEGREQHRLAYCSLMLYCAAKGYRPDYLKEYINIYVYGVTSEQMKADRETMEGEPGNWTCEKLQSLEEQGKVLAIMRAIPSIMNKTSYEDLVKRAAKKAGV